MSKGFFDIERTEPIEGSLISELYAGIMFNTAPIDPTSGSIGMIGVSGSGKAGRAKIIAEYGNSAHVESGLHFRGINERLKADTLGNRAISELVESLEKTELEALVTSPERVRQELNGISSALTPQQVAMVSAMRGGILVPNWLAVGEMLHLLDQHPNRRYVLDGILRQKDQVEPVLDKLRDYNVPLVGVLVVDFPIPKLVDRIISRRGCEPCGLEYSLQAQEGDPRYLNPALRFNHDGYETGACIKCGEPALRRPDDKPEKVANRVGEYENKVVPTLKLLHDMGIPIAVCTSDIPYSKDRIRDNVRHALAAGMTCEMLNIQPVNTLSTRISRPAQNAVNYASP